MSNRTLSLNENLYQYLLEHSLRESDVACRLREFTQGHEWARMQIAPEQGQFMALLVELTGATHLLEVGTFTGYSALCMAEVLPSDGELICCDINADWVGLAEPYWNEAAVNEKIRVEITPAVQTLESLLQNGRANSIDLMFVDADKENYLNYYELGLQLVRSGGLMIFDNTLWGGAVADPEINDDETSAIRALNDQLHGDDRISLSLVPIGDGLTLARKRP